MMATSGFTQPFYIVENGGQIEFGTQVGGQFHRIYGCADLVTASEVSLFFNLAWQGLKFGAVDPALKTEFENLGLHELYGRDDLDEVLEIISDLGIYPGDPFLN